MVGSVCLAHRKSRLDFHPVLIRVCDFITILPNLPGPSRCNRMGRVDLSKELIYEISVTPVLRSHFILDFPKGRIKSQNLEVK